MNLQDWVARRAPWGAGACRTSPEAGTPVGRSAFAGTAAARRRSPGEQLVQASQDCSAPRLGPVPRRGSADMTVASPRVRCPVSFFRTVRGIALRPVRLLHPQSRTCTPVTCIRTCAGSSCHYRPRYRLGPDRPGKSTTLAALIEGNQFLAACGTFVHAREPARVPVHESALVHPPARNPDTRTELRAGRVTLCARTRTFS